MCDSVTAAVATTGASIIGKGVSLTTIGDFSSVTSNAAGSSNGAVLSSTGAASSTARAAGAAGASGATGATTVVFELVELLELLELELLELVKLLEDVVDDALVAGDVV